MHGPPAERIQTMHHVPEICVGKACSPDESTFSPGSSGTMQSKKTTQSKTHFRTIAPKVAPKVVSPCPSSFTPSVADITTSNAKPFIMQTQNYALMKVTGQDGTISLVALPQVTPSMGGQVIQTTGIPLQENLKLPIPRYQPSRVKKSLNKKSRVLNKTKFEKIAVGKIEDNQESFMIPDTKEATIPHSTSMTSVEEAVSECGMFPGSGAQVVNVCNSALPLIDKAAGFILPSTSPTKLNVDLEKVGLGESGTAVKCNGSKVADSANPGVLSPVVFGSPVHLISNVPQGKLPILPYSKIKKSILSNCKQSTDPSSSSELNVALCGMQTSPGDTWASPSSVSISQIPTPGGPYQPVPKHDGDLNQQNGVPGKKRGKKRKALNEILGYQTKIRPLGNKLIVSKEKIKSQAAEASDKKTAVVKKYRNIMPKPFVDIQDLASFSGSCVKESLTGESMLRNRLINVRTPKWRQCETFPVVKNDCKIPSSAKLLYNCHICDHSFQFKHHLQDHLNSHSNKRPYHCRLCRKAYVHSGSLSTHMKLHHSDSRLKKLMCCEFCAKVFGHIRVYFGHLKEVHKVIISTELSAKQVERKKQTHKDEANILDGRGRAFQIRSSSKKNEEQHSRDLNKPHNYYTDISSLKKHCL
ncbi:zinc finger protein 438 isoform X2 [Pyxicephalus adspersus]|uniref:C2H2-type domain-containing protein n=1 Tax=Pyxicephalus adspersus TaxID=30357 RepID=A0AAV3A2E2_PYXAD|nr:TPA: hypothetical protein GDO54_012694 [Pyxicephalus adspersus]